MDRAGPAPGECGVRWERLFADLEGGFDEAERAERAAEVAERSRAEFGRLVLADRLRAAIGEAVQLDVRRHGRVDGRVERVGPDWLLLAEAGGRQALVPLAAVQSLSGLGAWASEPGSEGVVAARLGLRHALRELARNRAGVTVVLSGGGVVTGTIDRVGSDFLEMGEHPLGEQRRAADVRRTRLVTLAAVVLVRSR